MIPLRRALPILWVLLYVTVSAAGLLPHFHKEGEYDQGNCVLHQAASILHAATPVSSPVVAPARSTGTVTIKPRSISGSSQPHRISPRGPPAALLSF